ncbi:MAG: HAD family hydrolase [Candidatus Marsarchaeota archaeon]|nr:HAD family hydrolase [Candidatus Marsarchaeota archaeon]
MRRTLDPGRKYTCVLFDYDGTLMDNERSVQLSLKAVIDLMHEELGVSQRKATQAILKVSSQMERLHIYSRHVWWRAVAKSLNVTVTASQLLRFTLAYWTTYNRCEHPASRSLEIISSLRQRGVKLGILTDTDGYFGGKRWRLSSYPYLNMFQVVVVAGEDCPQLKPSPEAFVKALTSLRSRPEESLFVGDNPSTDVAGARSAGLNAVLLNRNGESSSTGSSTITRFSELARVLLE